MKLIRKEIVKDGAGTVTMVPEEEEDMWHAYNLIQEGDLLRASTVRKVMTESATGSTSSQRVHTTLTVEVESIDYDSVSGVLHVKGRNKEENQYVKLGAYHTLDLDLNRKFALTKGCWDVVHLERVEACCDVAQRADVAAVVMQEGLAHVCLITPSMTVVRAKIDMNIPRKRKGNVTQHEKGLLKFFDSVMQAVLRHVNFSVVKCVIVASPGFVREEFYNYVFQQADKEGNKSLLENKPKFLLVHSSSGFKHSLNEVLADPQIATKLADTKASSDVKVLETFFELLQTEPHRAYYGIDHVEKANEAMAIETLMITDALFRSKDLAARKRYVKLWESVKEQGGNVRLFSSLHVSGEQLGQLSGVAAILRFPMPEIEDAENDDEQQQEEQPATAAAASQSSINE